MVLKEICNFEATNKIHYHDINRQIFEIRKFYHNFRRIDQYDTKYARSNGFLLITW
jgi:hypothetical protein